MFFKSTLFLALIVGLATKDAVNAWSYTDQDDWVNESQSCEEGNQSPINLLSSSRYQLLPAFNFIGYTNTPTSQTITNDGHTSRVEFADNIPQISGGGLSGTYQFLQYHVHWGTSDSAGSEHQIDGQQRAFELHLVHWKTSYGTVENALTKRDGLAVLGILYNVGSANSDLQPLVSHLSKITAATSSTPETDMPTLAALLPSDTNNFYRYKGSLTTPTCNDAVIWTVFKEELSISSAQLSAFRTLQDTSNNALTFTFRRIQTTGGRAVRQSRVRSSSTSSGSSGQTGANGGTSTGNQAANLFFQNLANFFKG